MIKIVSWNCYNGFSLDKANAFIKILEDTNNVPDILVIQECKEKDCKNLSWVNKAWFGDGKDSYLGVGVFSNEYIIERTLEHNINYRYVIPYRIIKNNNSFILFAVWTKNVCCDYPYIGQLYGAINYPGYRKLLNEPVIIIGDFNANKKWDDEDIKINNPTYSEVLHRFEEKGIKSLYHEQYKYEHGNEFHKTHYNLNQKRFYHIDYCFCSKNMNPKKISIAAENEWENKNDRIRWKGLSDHCPIIVDFDF
jgi:exonuclease III